MAEPTLTVEIAPASTPLATAPTWIDISADVHGLEIHRGFGSELDTVADAGTATIYLSGAARKYDPTYASNVSPGNLVPGKQVRVRMVWNSVTYDIFRGHVEGWPQEYTKGSGKDIIEVALPCVDGKQYLANAVLENDAVVSARGRAIFHSRKRKLGGFHQWMTRGPEGAATSLEESSHEDLIAYSKPWAYWAVSGDDFDDTVGDRVGDKHLIPKNGASVNQLGTGELVQGDEYPPASMNFTRSLSHYWKTTGGLEVPQFKSMVIECVFQLATVPSSIGAGTVYRLVTGPLDSANIGAIFNLEITGADQIHAQVRLTDNGLYGLTLGTVLTAGPIYYGALVYDSAAGTIGVRLNATGSSGATGAGALAIDDPGNNNNIFIGGQPNLASPGPFDGKIQHVAIYNRVLTSTTMNTRYPSIPLGFPTGDSATTRIAAILDVVSWPASWRDLNTGTSATLIGRRYSNQSAMDEIHETEAANFGRFWLGPDGFVVTYERDWRNHADFSSSAATFGDRLDLGDMAYYGLGKLERTDDTKISRVLCKSAADEAVQMNEDAAIVPPVTLDLGEVILDTAASASSLASALVTRYKTPGDRFRELTIRPSADPTNLWPKVLGYDLCKQITIKRRPLGSADTAISQASHIEQISHSYSARGGGGMAAWETTWTVSPR